MDDWLKDLIQQDIESIYYSTMNTTSTVVEPQEPLTREKILEMCEKFLPDVPRYDHYVLLDDGSIVGYKKPYFEGTYFPRASDAWCSQPGIPDNKIKE